MENVLIGRLTSTETRTTAEVRMIRALHYLSCTILENDSSKYDIFVYNEMMSVCQSIMWSVQA